MVGGFQSCSKPLPAPVRKNTVSPARVISPGVEEPGRRSLTREVPAAVPSLFHSSAPVEPSSAWKSSVPSAVGRPQLGALGSGRREEHWGGPRERCRIVVAARRLDTGCAWGRELTALPFDD